MIIMKREMTTFIWNHSEKYDGRKGKWEKNIVVVINDENTLKKYDKIAYSYVKRNSVLESDIRKVQFSMKHGTNWWKCKEPANAQRDLLKAMLSAGQKIGGYQRLHGIHVFFDTDETIVATYEFYTIRGYGSPDEILLTSIQNMIIQSYPQVIPLISLTNVEAEVEEENVYDSEAVADEIRVV
jgi:hypothetical protein